MTKDILLKLAYELGQQMAQTQFSAGHVYDKSKKILLDLNHKTDALVNKYQNKDSVSFIKMPKSRTTLPRDIPSDIKIKNV